jgi:hypothetical protein
MKFSYRIRSELQNLNHCIKVKRAVKVGKTLFPDRVIAEFSLKSIALNTE